MEVAPRDPASAAAAGATAEGKRATLVVRVDLGTDDTTVVLSISDDGTGGADPGQGSGLVGLKDRIEALGGTGDAGAFHPDGAGDPTLPQCGCVTGRER